MQRRRRKQETRRFDPPRSGLFNRREEKLFLILPFPPIVFSFANTASTLRSSRCFSVGSNSGSLRVVSEAGSRLAPPWAISNFILV
jgi:hypothetical protein